MHRLLLPVALVAALAACKKEDPQAGAAAQTATQEAAAAPFKQTFDEAVAENSCLSSWDARTVQVKAPSTASKTV